MRTPNLKALALIVTTATTLLTACQGESGTAGGNLTLNNGASAPGCASGDNDKICIGVSYVAYKNSEGKSVLNEAQAIDNIQKVNKVWAKCGIAFQVEEFQNVDPTAHSLPYSGPAVESGTNAARGAFLKEAEDKFLILATGNWNVSKNAWAAMPGSSPYGVVMEAQVATDGNIIAHELGHYLNLDHASVGTNLLSPVIYPNSNVISDAQCETARESARIDWPHMLR